MERIWNLLLGVLNWYENTTVRRSDPKEIKALKRCERRAVGSCLLTLLFIVVYAWLGNNVPDLSTPMERVFAPIFRYTLNGIALMGGATALMTLYYAGKGVYHQVSLQ